MKEELIRGAANQAWETAMAAERAIEEVLAAFREGRFDPAPVGSPAYVRKLRDQAAVALRTMPPDGGGLFYENKDAVGEANVLVTALGYPVPEDTP